MPITVAARRRSQVQKWLRAGSVFFLGTLLLAGAAAAQDEERPMLRDLKLGQPISAYLKITKIIY